MCHAATAGSDLGKILAIIAVGMPASLIFTAQVAVTVRKAVNTKLEDTPTPKKLPPFKPFHYSLWGAPLHSCRACSPDAAALSLHRCDGNGAALQGQ